MPHAEHFSVDNSDDGGIEIAAAETRSLDATLDKLLGNDMVELFKKMKNKPISPRPPLKLVRSKSESERQTQRWEKAKESLRKEVELREETKKTQELALRLLEFGQANHTDGDATYKFEAAYHGDSTSWEWRNHECSPITGATPMPQIKRCISPVLKQLDGVRSEFSRISDISQEIWSMLESEMITRVERSTEWDEFIKQFQDVKSLDTTQENVAVWTEATNRKEKLEQWKNKVDEGELNDLPGTFVDLWKVIEKQRFIKTLYEEIDVKTDWTYNLNTEKKYENLTKRPQPIEDFIELFRVCQEIQPKFEEHLKSLAKKHPNFPDEPPQDKLAVGLHLAPPKKRVRGMYKYLYKYHKNAAKLTDINRASFIFGKGELKRLYDFVAVVDAHFKVIDGVECGGIVNIKDRIANPTPAGYKDVLLNVEFPYRTGGKIHKILCEIQLHYKPLHDIKCDKRIGGHANYKIARHFGMEFEKLCFN